MTGQINISGSTASVQLKGNDSITTDQTFTFPNAGGELVVTPGTADIKTSGSIIAAGDLHDFGAYTFDSTTTSGIRFESGSITSQRTLSSGNTSRAIAHRYGADITFEVLNNGTATFSSNKIRLFPGGSANYVGGINIGVANGDSDGNDATIGLNSGGSAFFKQNLSNTFGSPTVVVANSQVAEAIRLNNNGTALFTGAVTAPNVFFNLEPDNPSNYVSTTNAQGETEQIYSGPTLDVRQVLLDLQSKVEALQAEIQTLKGGAS